MKPAAAVVTVTACTLAWLVWPAPPAPHSSADLVSLAEARGLYPVSSRADGAFLGDFYVADHRRAWEGVTSLSPSAPDDPGWDGVVLVTHNRDGYLPLQDTPHRCGRLGRYVLFGDPAVIRQLTAR